VWANFVDVYTPVISSFCLRRGLSPADTSDVVQEVMRVVLKSIKTFDYDPAKGRFRSWLYSVVRTRICQFFRDKARRPVVASGGTTMMQFIAEHPTPEEEEDWDEGYRQRIFEWASGRVKGDFADKTWDAFWQTAVEHRPVEDVAEALEMKLGSIYVAKSRIVARLRREVESLNGEWDIVETAA
jgi:RNA polymerase sigma-70 factor (ECF subfamily)